MVYPVTIVKTEVKKMFKNDRIEKRLKKSFVAVTAMAAVSAIIAVIALAVICNRYSYALTQYGFSQGDIGNAMAAFSGARSSTRAVIAYSDPELIAYNVTAHDEQKKTCQEYFEAMKSTLSTTEEKEEYQKIADDMEKFWQLDQEILELGNTTDQAQSAQAQARAADELAAVFDDVYNALSALMQVNVDKGKSLDSSLNLLSIIMIIAVIFIIAVVMTVSIKFGKNIAKQIADGLTSVSERLTTFAQGDLSSGFPVFDTDDEVNDLAVTTRDMAGSLTVIINSLNDQLKNLSGGDFTSHVENQERFVGDFASLKDGLEILVSKMRDTLLQIDEASVQVDAGSGQLAESATALAEGATDQAGAVEELTATVTDVAASSEESAKQIGAAYEEGLTYKQQAEHGSEEMNNLISAMERISEASKQIENIIEEIEDIASQTNLLSLNASIEAARAGEAGKGFAVVADQIGKLAMDSAQSAVKTRELIHNALDEVEAGNTMTQRTKQALEEVIGGIEFLSNVTKEASDTSYSQAETMLEIQKGIEQISGVIQSNSASAEETSATSQELAAQSTSLKELLGQFTLE